MDETQIIIESNSIESKCIIMYQTIRRIDTQWCGQMIYICIYVYKYSFQIINEIVGLYCIFFQWNKHWQQFVSTKEQKVLKLNYNCWFYHAVFTNNPWDLINYFNTNYMKSITSYVFIVKFCGTSSFPRRLSLAFSAHSSIRSDAGKSLYFIFWLKHIPNFNVWRLAGNNFGCMSLSNFQPKTKVCRLSGNTLGLISLLKQNPNSNEYRFARNVFALISLLKFDPKFSVCKLSGNVLGLIDFLIKIPSQY